MVDLSLTRITSIGTFYLKSTLPFLNKLGIEEAVAHSRNLEEGPISLSVLTFDGHQTDTSWNITEVSDTYVLFQLLFNDAK